MSQNKNALYSNKETSQNKNAFDSNKETLQTFWNIFKQIN